MNLRKVLILSGMTLGLGVLATSTLPQLFPWRPPAAITPEIGQAPDAPTAHDSTIQPNHLTARPMFWSSRRPPPPPAVEAPLPQEPSKEEFPKDVKLLGLYGSGLARGALIKTGKEVKRIPLGSAGLQGWKLVEATEGVAKFSSPRGNLLHDLLLKSAPSTPQMPISPSQRQDANKPKR